MLAFFPGAQNSPYYVNMKAPSGGYSLGRYLWGKPSPVGPIAAGGCGLWAPSVVTGKRTRLVMYAMQNDCRGWHQLIAFGSPDGVSFTRLATVLSDDVEMRMPAVVRAGNRYHLWYSSDRGGFASVLMHASSTDGLRFSRPRPVLRAGRLTAIAAASVVRDRGVWHMFLQGYSRDLSRAYPYHVTFRDPDQRRYRLGARIKTSRAAPKVDMSWVCRTPRGYRGIFTLYGAGGSRLGREWTAPYESSRLAGPWRALGDSTEPLLTLDNLGQNQSVENPTQAIDSPRIPRC